MNLEMKLSVYEGFFFPFSLQTSGELDTVNRNGVNPVSLHLSLPHFLSVGLTSAFLSLSLSSSLRDLGCVASGITHEVSEPAACGENFLSALFESRPTLVRQWLGLSQCTFLRLTTYSNYFI